MPSYLEGKGSLNSDFNKVIIKIKRKLRLTLLTSAEHAFISSLKKNKIQLVFAQYGTTAYRIVSICKCLKIPLITHFHGYDASVDSVIKSCNNYKEVFDYSTYVIAVSLSMKDKLIELGCPQEKVIYNTYGPNNLFLEIVPKFLEPIFIGLGRFVNKKAPYYTILAFKQVVEKFPKAQLVIGGNGELYEVCKNLVSYYQLENNVILPGVLSPKDFEAYLSKSLAFVQHSITAINGDQEGTPVAILEASAAGLPVISTFHAGIPDVIIDGETGFLVPEHDVDAMAQKMMLLLENTSLALQIGAKGKNRIRECFTLERHLRTIDELIEKAIYRNE
ncbi:glycosyltransferase [Flavobacterium nitratireducens]|uniref:glycosyltransferase n=1 Tax=Flavobacterium nitratireducens TaxID=992289 RepID=UPI00241552C4|nr:glycosyltransferase [Flavobacterium nitratireducens]